MTFTELKPHTQVMFLFLQMFDSLASQVYILDALLEEMYEQIHTHKRVFKELDKESVELTSMMLQSLIDGAWGFAYSHQGITKLFDKEVVDASKKRFENATTPIKEVKELFADPLELDKNILKEKIVQLQKDLRAYEDDFLVRFEKTLLYYLFGEDLPFRASPRTEVDVHDSLSESRQELVDSGFRGDYRSLNTVQLEKFNIYFKEMVTILSRKYVLDV